METALEMQMSCGVCHARDGRGGDGNSVQEEVAQRLLLGSSLLCELTVDCALIRLMDRTGIQSSAELLRESNFLGMSLLPSHCGLELVKKANSSNHGFVYKAPQQFTRCCCAKRCWR